MPYTASTLLLDTLHQAGVSYVFANFGSDHPALVEAFAEAEATGRQVPKLLTCPNEMVALHAAIGYAQATGRAQAVIVHVECGTQSLAGAVHNAAKGRVPVFIFAGLSPFTQAGELFGSRNEFIQWIQDVPDQRGIVRGYVKYENEFRTPHNIPQILLRALQFAHSEPQGPVYVTGAREVMEAAAAPQTPNLDHWRPIEPAALPETGVAEIAAALAAAKNPLIVTSYVGRDARAVMLLETLAVRLGIGVLDSVPSRLNFPTTHKLYQGNQWNRPHQNEALAAADVVVVLCSDVPWIPAVSRPAEGARIYVIDPDPLKHQMPLWYIQALKFFRADAVTALAQLNAWVTRETIDPAAKTARHAARHNAWREHRDALEQPQAAGAQLTGAHAVAALRAHLDESCIILNEGISNYHTVIDHLHLTRPGCLFASGGGSLGWHGGAAIGHKLANPGATIIALAGDGSYMFSDPASTHWISRRYNAPFLTIIFNNGGWKSPKLSALALHPAGHASRALNPGVSFAPPPDYAAIAAAAGGAFGRKVETVEELNDAIKAALHAVREERRSAVLDVVVEGL